MVEHVMKAYRRLSRHGKFIRAFYMKPYAPPPPPGASRPPLWATSTTTGAVRRPGRRPGPRAGPCHGPLRGADRFREYWKRNYGPTIAVYRFNADDPERVEQLDRDFLDFLTTWNRGGTYTAEYLLITARKR